MTRYNYTMHDGHFIVAADGQKLLLDTGSPVSIGDRPFVLGNQEHDPDNSLMGITVGQLCDMVGTEFDALVGMDVLGRAEVCIDRQAQTVSVDSSIEIPDAIRYPLRFPMGIPTLQTDIGGETVSLFFDTGAKISYLPAQRLAGYEPVSAIEDFYPGLGPFTAEVHRVTVEFGCHPQELEVGALPDALALMVNATGVDGILGNNCWENRTLLLSAAQSKLFIRPVGWRPGEQT